MFVCTCLTQASYFARLRASTGGLGKTGLASAGTDRSVLKSRRSHPCISYSIPYIHTKPCNMDKEYVDHKIDIQSDIEMHNPFTKRSQTDLQKIIKVHIMHIKDGEVQTTSKNLKLRWCKRIFTTSSLTLSPSDRRRCCRRRRLVEDRPSCRTRRRGRRRRKSRSRRGRSAL